MSDEGKRRKGEKRRREGRELAPERQAAIVAYLLVRTDLPSLGRGKAYAHACHAGNQITHDTWVVPLAAGLTVDARIPAWHRQGGGFGTTLAVGGERQADLATLRALVAAAEGLGFPAGLVVDDRYPYRVDDEIMPLLRRRTHTSPPRRVRDGWACTRRETTAAWVLGDKTELKVLLQRFDLTPDD